MKIQGEELSYYNSKFLSKQLGIYNALKWLGVGFCVFICIAFLLFFSSDFPAEYIIMPIISALLFSFLTYLAFLRAKGIKQELDSREHKGENPENIHKAEKNAKWKLIAVVIASILLIIIMIISITSNMGNRGSDDYWDDYDYDDDGDINQNEWEDALGDYMDDIMGY